MTLATNATHVVLRPISGMPFAAGDLVDASAWRRPERFEARRYLRPLAADDVQEPATTSPDSRASIFPAQGKKGKGKGR